MHIAFNGWFWDQTNTGSGQYLRRLLHHLRALDAGLKLTLVLPPHNNTPDDLPRDVNIITTGNGERATHWAKVWFEQRTFPQLARRAGADIAHVPYWGPPLASPVKVVTSVLDVIPLIFPLYSRGILARLYLSLVGTAARDSQHIITISESSKIDIEQYLQIPPERISAIYLAPDTRFHPKADAEQDAQVRAKYSLPDPFILYLGGFDRRKRLDALLYAYTYIVQAEGDQYPLVIAGREPQWGTPMFPDMRAYADKLGISPHLRWIGHVDEADKAALYRMAKVFVFPSEYEGFGLPVIEAMACGTPVVAQNIDVFDEICGDAAFLVDDARGMAGAILALLNQPPLHAAMSNQSIGRASQYHWRKTAQQTLKVYEYVAQLGGR